MWLAANAICLICLLCNSFHDGGDSLEQALLMGQGLILFRGDMYKNGPMKSMQLLKSFVGAIILWHIILQLFSFWLLKLVTVNNFWGCTESERINYVMDGASSYDVIKGGD